jgi:iron complex outermembrane receptor protein
MKTGISVLALATALMGYAAPAWAQIAADSSEVVITGRGGLTTVAEGGALGDRSILNTPFSVTVVEADDIALRQPLTLGQVFVNDPGVFSFASAGTVNWWGTQIRGLGVRNYYVDDTPLVLYWGGDYPLEAVESVQALKGATGFMYGFGSPGGAISYRTKRPTGAPMLSTELGFRGRSVISGHLDSGGPLSEDGKLGYRVNLAADKGEEYNAAEIDRGLASLALDYKFAPNLVWRSTFSYENYDLSAEPFHVYWESYGDAVLPRVPTDWNNLHVDNSYYRYALFTGATSLDWRFSDAWSATLDLGYTRKRHHSNKTFVDILNQAGDYDGFVYQFGELDRAKYAQARVQGEATTGPLRHDLVFGASWQKADGSFGDNSVYSNDFGGNIFAAQPYLIPGVADTSTDGYPYDERQTAAFASDTIHFGKHWQAILGLRHTDYEQRDSNYKTSVVSPTVALLYKPIDKTTLYASYVESMEGGGRVLDPIYANFGATLEATISKQYEAGFKYDGKDWRLTAAAFRIERVEPIDEQRGADLFLVQDGLTVYNGVELIGETDVTDDLTLGLGLVHLDAAIEDVSTANAAIEGNRPFETAEWQAVANASYKVPAIRGLRLHGDVRYSGSAPTDSSNVLFIPGYTLASAGFSYDFNVAGKDVQFIGNINNLFNEKYWGLENFGESRNGTLALRVKW